MEPFAARLHRAIEEKGSCLVVGMDPVLERLPGEIFAPLGGYQPMADGRPGAGHTARASAALALFAREVIELVAPHAVALKPNAAFFERFGPPGVDALVETCREARRRGLLVILDAKRGDLSSTAEGYAHACLGDLPDTPGEVTDAVTINPYFGIDGVKPFLDLAREQGKGVFILVRTSNPSAVEFQELESGGEPIYLHVARKVAEWSETWADPDGFSPVGAVVGATAPGQAEQVRGILGRSIFLVPGYGAQGAGAESVRPHFLPGGKGAVVNSSRGVIFAYEKSPERPWRECIEEAARRSRDELEAVRRET